MAYKLKITPSAEKDLDQIFSYLINEIENERYARKFKVKLYEGYTQICNLPESCPISLQNDKFRKLNVDKYLVFYQYDKKRKMIIVSRIFHGMMDYAKYL